MSVSYEYCVLSSRDLCDGPIPRPEESYDNGVSLCVKHKPQNETALNNVGLLRQREREGEREREGLFKLNKVPYYCLI
jgi:hypothetical protein